MGVDVDLGVEVEVGTSVTGSVSIGVALLYHPVIPVYTLPSELMYLQRHYHPLQQQTLDEQNR